MGSSAGSKAESKPSSDLESRMNKMSQAEVSKKTLEYSNAVPESPLLITEEDSISSAIKLNGDAKKVNGESKPTKRFFTPDMSLEPKNTKESIRSSFVWTATTGSNFKLTSYLLQKFIRDFSSEFWFQFQSDQQSLSIGVGKTDTYFASALIVFIFQGSVFTLHTNSNNNTNMLSSSVEDVNMLGNEINQIIKATNHLRGNVLYFDDDNLHFKGVPSVTFESAIFAEDIKQDIVDNTIFHIQNMEQSNGIIFWGPPGTGKSLLCSAIINDAFSKKISTVYSSSLPNFNALEELIEKYLGDTIVFLEDIDAYGFSRDGGSHNPVISGFLQFMNGIAQRKDRVIVVATTNHLEVLDKAIGQRPVRFNRKFNIDYPKNTEIDALVRLYIGDNVNSALCHKKEFSGSHIAEIRRTIDLARKKNNTTIEDEYENAVKIVEKTFSIGLMGKRTGFQTDRDEEK